MTYRLLKDTPDAYERLTEILGKTVGIVKELRDRGLSAQRRPELLQKTLLAVSEVLDAALNFSIRKIPDDTYRHLDEMFDSIIGETRLALLENDLGPIVKRLRGLESDFCDFSALVGADERQSIVRSLEECGNMISEARNLARGLKYAESQVRVQQISTRSKSLESMIDTAKVSAFNRGTQSVFRG